MRKTFLSLIVLFSIFSILVPCYAADSITDWTEDEVDFINKHPVIKLGVDPGFVPFEFIDIDGEYKGIASDYISLINEKLDIQFEVVRGLTWPEAYNKTRLGEIDVLPAISKTEEREQHFLFSEPYYYTKRVIVTKDTEMDITGIEDLDGQIAAVQRNSSHHSYLLSNPKIHLSLYDSAEAALRAVSNGSERVLVGNIDTTNYLIHTTGLTNLKFTAFEAEEQQPLYFAVRKDLPELVSILNKTLHTITEEEKITINNKWVSLEQKKDYSSIIRIISIIGVLAAVVMAVSFYWIILLKKEIQKRELIQIELQHLYEQKLYYQGLTVDAVEESLKESERSKSVLLSHLPGMAYRCNYDRDWTMQYVSAGCFNLTGYTPENLINNRELSFNDIIIPEYRKPIWKEWKRILAKKVPFKYEYEIMTAQGERKWVLEMGQGVYDNEGEVDALEGIILDTSERKEFENNLKFISEHDTLTGLYNRRYLENLLAEDAKMHSTDKRAVISVNLSAIHSLSLTYGYHYSMKLIKKAADTLKKHCTDERQLYYTYENHFVFYVKDYKDKDELTVFCEDVVSTLESILSIERISGGIGIVEIDEDNKHNIQQFLKNLLIASEKALNLKNREFGFCFFDTDMEAETIREEEIKYELAEIEVNENYDGIFMQFQPILDIKSNKTSDFEALVRINSSKLGLLKPSEFIPIAEETKLIIPLGYKVLIQAFKFINMLKEAGYDNICVSINISVVQLVGDDFIKNIFELIDEMQVNPANIILEITESMFASDYYEINRILGKLKELGIKIALDDFGTGYSSLARERELNVNIIKIDKYFSDKLLILNNEESITKEIISMVHKLGHIVIAEGVEFEEQRQYYKNCGCDKLQGYLISEPLDKNEAIEFLRKQ